MWFILHVFRIPKNILKMKYHLKSNRELIVELNQVLESSLSDSDIRIEDIADSLSMSKRQLYRRVQEITGKTPNEYFKDLKFARAYQYLQTKTYQTVMETSSAVGFRDTVYFSRQFRKRYGKLPSEVLN